MAARTQPNLIDQTITNSAKNGLRLAGFDIKDISSDRPLPPDGLKVLAAEWFECAICGKNTEIHYDTQRDIDCWKRYFVEKAEGGEVE